MKMAVLLRCFRRQREREVQTALVSLHLKLSDKLPLHCKFSSKLVVTVHKLELFVAHPPPPQTHVSGQWEEAGLPGENPRSDGEERANSAQTKPPRQHFLNIWLKLSDDVYSGIRAGFGLFLHL